MTTYKITLKATHGSFIIFFSFSLLTKLTLDFIGCHMSCHNLDVQISLLKKKDNMLFQVTQPQLLDILQ